MMWGLIVSIGSVVVYAAMAAASSQPAHRCSIRLLLMIFSSAEKWDGRVRMAAGCDEAVDAFRRSASLSRDANSISNLGHAYARSGQKQKVLALLRELSDKRAREYVREICFTVIRAGLGDPIALLRGWRDAMWSGIRGSSGFPSCPVSTRSAKSRALTISCDG